jgi:hypothetical protein
VKWVFLSVLTVCVAALGGFAIYTFGRDNSSTSRVQPTNSPSTTTHPPDPNDVSSYYSADGSRPALFPTCEGILSICLGTPLERVRALLGVEDSRSAAGGDVYRTWTVGNPGVSITLTTDDVGAVKFLTATLDESKGLRVGLPKHLVMGESTMGDVVKVFGKPLKQTKQAAETQVFYLRTYYAGGEGSEKQTFGYATLYGTKADPKAFNAILRTRPVNSYTLCYADAEC